MRTLIVSMLIGTATVAAQAPDPISIAELLDAYKGTVAEARGTTAARFEAMLATPQGVAYERALRHQEDVEKRLAARIQERTGKIVNWTTGALGEPSVAPESGTR